MTILVPLQRLLAGFTGVLLSDGWDPYAVCAAKFVLVHAGCWAHARRKFEGARKVQIGEEQQRARRAARLSCNRRKSLHNGDIVSSIGGFLLIMIGGIYGFLIAGLLNDAARLSEFASTSLVQFLSTVTGTIAGAVIVLRHDRQKERRETVRRQAGISTQLSSSWRDVIGSPLNASR